MSSRPDSARIITPRLVLRPPVLADAEAIHAAKEAMWPQLQLWMSWAYPEQSTLEATENYIAHYPGALCAFEKETGDFVLASGLDPEDEPGVYTTGYWAAKDKQGRGYATEATNAAIRYAFGALGAKMIRISYYAGNGASRRVVEKLGFTQAEFLPEKHPRCSDGVLLDEYRLVMTSPGVLPPLDVRWE